MKASGGQKHTIQRDSRSARSMLTALCNERTGCVDRPGAAGRISYDPWFFRQSVNSHWVMAVCRFRPRLPGAFKRGSGPLLTLATSAILVGCSLGPAYKRPDAAQPSAWRESIDSQATSWPSVDWWRGFGSPELDSYMAQAQGANNDIAAAVARVRQADALATIAGAALLPAVGASATALTERTQATDGTNANFHQVSPQVTASYMIDFWGRNRAARRAAIATATASRRDQATI